jgi:hypothetical protein
MIVKIADFGIQQSPNPTPFLNSLPYKKENHQAAGDTHC